MKNSMQSDVGFSIATTLGLALITIIYLINSTPIIYPDSPSYIMFHAVRPPVYPIFIWLFHFFGQNQFIFLMWTQSILLFIALIYAKHWLHSRLNISNMTTFFVLLFTMLLLFYYKMPREVCSEAIAFPLFIVTFLLMVDCFDAFNLKRVILLCILTNLLILTRLQFYYFYLLFLMQIAWFVWKKIPAKMILASFLIMIISIVFTVTLNRGYHYAMNGKFAESPVIGRQLIIQALYLSDSNAIQYFKNDFEKNIFTNILNKIEKQHLTLKSEQQLLSMPQQTTYGYYYATYNPILDIVDDNIPGKSLYEIDATAFSISKTLYMNALKENLLFYLIKISSFFGGMPNLLSFLIILSGSLFYVLTNKNKSINLNQIFTLISLITIFINTAFVMIPEAGQANYFFYSYFLIYCLAGLLVKQFQYIE